MKYTIRTTKNRIHAGGEFELDAEKILANDVILPGERHPHNVRLWVIGNEYGAICAVWASNEQDALDEMVDSDLGNSFLISDENLEKMNEAEREDLSYLGNASEAADLSHCWMGEAEFQPERDLALLLAFAEARGACADNLDKI